MRNTKVRKKRLMRKGSKSSLKIYRFIILNDFIPWENIR